MRIFSLSMLCLMLFIQTSCRKKKDIEPQGEIILPKDMVIIDAEYNKKKDILVYVTNHPAQLNIFIPAQNKTETVPLEYIPMSVSIAQDGSSAVVGFDAKLSHVDLNKKTILNTFSVSCEALDIVLGNNNWAYVFPKRDQWATVRCIDLATGKETAHTGSSMYAGSKGKLHPSGNFIYSTNNFVSPTDIEKYDIQNGTAARLYDSPYHGTYPVEGDLWFSEDGSRVFLRGQTTMRLSASQENDLIYNGTVGLDTIKNSYDQNKRIMSLDHSATANRLYVIASDTLYMDKPNVPYVWIYDATNLSYLYRKALKGIPASVTKTAYIEPYFVFTNSKGNQIYVVTKQVDDSTIKWSIQIL